MFSISRGRDFLCYYSSFLNMKITWICGSLACKIHIEFALRYLLMFKGMVTVAACIQIIHGVPW